MKHICFLITILICNQSQATNNVRILDNYDRNQREMVTLNETDKDHLDMLVEINETASLDQYLDNHSSERWLPKLYRAGLALMNSESPRPGVLAIKNGKAYLDVRALSILHFVYMLDPLTDPWLPYHYATTLIHFPNIAKNKYAIRQPIEHAFKVYDKWLQHAKTEEEHRDLLAQYGEEEPSAQIHTTTQAINMQQFESAHREFYALLSIKMLGANEDEQRSLLKGLSVYNPDRNEEPDQQNRSPSPQKSGFDAWLDHYGLPFLAAGAVLAPTFFVANYVAANSSHSQ